MWIVQTQLLCHNKVKSLDACERLENVAFRSMFSRGAWGVGREAWRGCAEKGELRKERGGKWTRLFASASRSEKPCPFQSNTIAEQDRDSSTRSSGQPHSFAVPDDGLDSCPGANDSAEGQSMQIALSVSHRGLPRLAKLCDNPKGFFLVRSGNENQRLGVGVPADSDDPGTTGHGFGASAPQPDTTRRSTRRRGGRD